MLGRTLQFIVGALRKKIASDKYAEAESATDEHSRHFSIKSLDVPVTSLMIPRDQIVALPVTASKETTIASFAQSKFTRIPIYESTLDEVIGFVHIKDILSQLDTDFKIADIVHRIYVVPGSIKAHDLLVMMKKSRIHAAIIVDEYGGTDGFVTLFDLIEELLGEEIRDEHKNEPDANKKQMMLVSENVYEISGRALISDIEEELKIKLKDNHKENFYTIGGLIFELMDRIPSKDEIILDPNTNVKFKITSATDRAVQTVEMDISGYAAKSEDSADND